MKIKFTRTKATAQGLFHDGDVADIFEATAKMYISKGHAVEVKEEKPKKKEEKAPRKTKENKSQAKSK